MKSRSASKAAGPMPFTFMSASSVANGPCCVRYSIMRSAIAGPILGSASSWAALAVLMFTIAPALPADASPPVTPLLASAVGLLAAGVVPARVRVGAGCVIGQDVRAEDYATLTLPAGSQLSR